MIQLRISFSCDRCGGSSWVCPNDSNGRCPKCGGIRRYSSEGIHTKRSRYNITTYNFNEANGSKYFYG